MTTNFHILYLSLNKLRQIFGNYCYIYIYNGNKEILTLNKSHIELETEEENTES